MVGGAVGAGVVGCGLIGFLGISPYAKAGQVIITVAGVGGAVGLSEVVDKALYKTMGLCK